MNKENLLLFMRLIKNLKISKKSYFFGLIGLSITTSLLPIILAFTLKFIIDYAVNRNQKYLVMSISIIAISTIVVSLLFIFFSFLFRSNNRKTISNVKIELFTHLQRLPMSYFDTRTSGEIISRCNNDVYQMEMTYGGFIRNLITITITGIYSLIAIIILNWKIGILLFAYAFIAYLINERFTKILKDISQKIQENAARISSIMIETIHSLPIVKLFYGIGFMKKSYKEAFDYDISLRFKSVKINSIYSAINTLIHWVIFSTIIFIGFISGQNDKTQIGNIVAIIELYSGVSGFFTTLGNFNVALQNSFAGIKRVFEIMDLPEENISIDKVTNCNDKLLSFNNVEFSYRDDEKVIKGVDFEIDKTGIYSFVGPSGSGKSTIMKLMLSLYNADEGVISIFNSGLDIKTIEQARSQFSYIPQNPHIFNSTIRENICYGKVNATDEEIVDAAKKAEIHEFIQSLDMKYDTILNENGVNLSGGQKQRIAIARALLKNTKFILLDEATSSLDSLNEDKIQEAILNNIKDKVIIIIAHRLSTIKNSNYIFFIDDGKITEQGTHDELMDHEGLYSEYYKYQMYNTGQNSIDER